MSEPGYTIRTITPKTWSDATEVGLIVSQLKEGLEHRVHRYRPIDSPDDRVEMTGEDFDALIVALESLHRIADTAVE